MRREIIELRFGLRSGNPRTLKKLQELPEARRLRDTADAVQPTSST